MIMRIEMPAVDASLRSGRIVRWHKEVGDAIGFGEPICDVAVDEFAVLRRTARATLLTGRRRKKLKSDLETREGKVYLEVTITSSDTGVLQRRLIEVGEPIEIGQTVALAATPDHAVPAESADDWHSAPPMRVVLNVVGGDDDLAEGM